MPRIKLHTLPVNGGAFNCQPAREIELDGERVLANNPIFPGEFNPHNVRLWVIGNEFGALGAVWADCEQDAFDTLVDEGLGDGLLVDEKDADEECARLGNAGEPANLDNVWICQVRLLWGDDAKVIAGFAEARGIGADSLGDIPLAAMA